jgi:hypothetical protein
MATTRKRSSATKKNKASSSRKLTLKKATLKDLTPQRSAAKGGALIDPDKPIAQSVLSGVKDPYSTRASKIA